MKRALLRGARGASLVALLFAVEPAQAHAPPLGARVLGNERGPQVVVTNRGLIFHEPATGTSRLLCNEALGVSTSELPSVALLEEGALLVGSSGGLKLSRDQGCTWQEVGPAPTGLNSAVARFPSDARSAIVASYDAEPPGLYRTVDAGATWTLAVATEPGDFVQSLLVAPAAEDHIYATVAQFGEMGPPSHWLLHSSDGGASWQRHPLPVTPDEAKAVAAASDPTDPEQLVLYTIANSPGLVDGRILHARNGGSTVEPAMEIPEIRDARYDAEGTLWIAARGGLYATPELQSPVEPVSEAYQLGCLAPSGGELLVCGHYAGEATSDFGVGRFNADTADFEPWLNFRSVGGLVECPEGSPTRVACAQPWVDWTSELQGPEERDEQALPGPGSLDLSPSRGGPPGDATGGREPTPVDSESAPSSVGSQGCSTVSTVSLASSKPERWLEGAWVALLALLALRTRGRGRSDSLA